MFAPRTEYVGTLARLLPAGSDVSRMLSPTKRIVTRVVGAVRFVKRSRRPKGLRSVGGKSREGVLDGTRL